MTTKWPLLCLGVLSSLTGLTTVAFQPSYTSSSSFPQSSTTTKVTKSMLFQASPKLSELPPGISPFEKSFATKNSLDIPGDLRKTCLAALPKAMKDGKRLLEIDFPPLLGKGKTQFDDFDNVQELNQNRDWCVQLLPLLSSILSPSNVTPKNTIWFLLPDVKEVQLCREEWTGQRYRQAATYTTIEAVTVQYNSKTKSSETTTTTTSTYTKPWGASLANGLQSLFQTNSLLGDDSLLDDVTSTTDSSSAPTLHLICQPGNGGPVEDWINCETLHNTCPNRDVTTLIVNGALDKVRDGYYPAIFFPALARTVAGFYNQFEPLVVLKPISDKGLYGWLYRVYPEPWQVVLQTVQTDRNDRTYVVNTVVFTSDKRPSYTDAVEQLRKGASQSPPSKR